MLDGEPLCASLVVVVPICCRKAVDGSWWVVARVKKLIQVMVVRAASFPSVGCICRFQFTFYMLGFDSEPKLRACECNLD